MKLHKKFDHALSGVGCWGERNDVPIRVNFGTLSSGEQFPEDPLHYHKTRTTYFCVLTGSMTIEVEGSEITVTSDAMLEVAPMEKYRTPRIGPEGCHWVVIGSHNEDDRIEVSV